MADIGVETLHFIDGHAEELVEGGHYIISLCGVRGPTKVLTDGGETGAEGADVFGVIRFDDTEIGDVNLEFWIDHGEVERVWDDAGG